jgi:hypothetical protein
VGRLLQYGYGWKHGLLAKFKNSTTFNITELVVVVQDQKSNRTNEYVINSFSEPLEGAGWITGPGDPALMGIMRVGQIRSFFVPATEITEDTVKDFGQRFTWNLRFSKGIPTQ